MRGYISLSILLILLIPNTLFAQRDSLRNIFLDAESWYQFEEYAEALPLFQGLLQSDPDNDLLKYKIGICLLNDPYQKDKSIHYLLEASRNINPGCKVSSYKENSAPPDALFYLGRAYQVNELLDKANESFERFLEILDPEIYDAEVVRIQIQACSIANELKARPVDFDLFLLDTMVNTTYADVNPVLSGDGTKMAFVTRLPFYDAAFYTHKIDQGWAYPQHITQSLGFDSDVYPVALSYDGTEMILYYDDEYTGNLYYSRYEGDRWLPATKLNEPISTKYWESHASFSEDGQSLYFTSNRKGTIGGLDIYRSQRLADGGWGIPENLGPTINSRYNEETPCISSDGQTLYFSSYGHTNMGGYDVFYSKRKEDGSWSEPVNLGYPINTTDDDLFFQAVNEGKNAYYSIYSPRGMGMHDIYYMSIYSADHPRVHEDLKSPDQVEQASLNEGAQEKDTVDLPLSYETLLETKAEDTATIFKDSVVKVSEQVFEATSRFAESASEETPETEVLEDTILDLYEPLKTDSLDATKPGGKESVKTDSQTGTILKGKGWLIWLLIAVGSGLLLWLILWRRRR